MLFANLKSWFSLGLRLTTPTAELDQYIERCIQRQKQAVIRALMYCGEQVLNTARSTNSYKDQTGNLRSSIGYVIAVDGNVISQSDFQVVKGGKEGQEQGSKFVRQIVKQFPKGVCLVLVAGMEYAVYVQNKGYDVLDNAELLAERIVPKMLKQLGFT